MINKGDKISGKIKSITDFGIFIGLEGGIDGLVHLSDISWAVSGEEAVRQYKKGDELEAVVLAVDPERERISLGVKQLDADPYSNYLSENPKGSIVTCTVMDIDPKRVLVELAEGVEGQIKVSELARERVEDPNTVVKVGDSVEAKFIGVDKKNRAIMLSIKAKETQDEAEVLKDYTGGFTAEGQSGSTLGDLLKEQISKDDTQA